MLQELGSAILKFFAELALVWIVLSYFFSPRRTFGLINSTWQHTFPDMKFSTGDFYAEVEEKIKKKTMPNIEIAVVLYSTKFFPVSERTYLQICLHEQMILVCAAPFGTDFFVSWRSGKKMAFIDDLILRIPVIGPPFVKLMQFQTFYKQDTDSMFKESVRQCVLEAIDEITSAKGKRGLTDLQRLETLIFSPIR